MNKLTLSSTLDKPQYYDNGCCSIPGFLKHFITLYTLTISVYRPKKKSDITGNYSQPNISIYVNNVAPSDLFFLKNGLALIILLNCKIHHSSDYWHYIWLKYPSLLSIVFHSLTNAISITLGKIFRCFICFFPNHSCKDDFLQSFEPMMIHFASTQTTILVYN